MSILKASGWRWVGKLWVWIYVIVFIVVPLLVIIALIATGVGAAGGEGVGGLPGGITASGLLQFLFWFTNGWLVLAFILYLFGTTIDCFGNLLRDIFRRRPTDFFGEHRETTKAFLGGIAEGAKLDFCHLW